jgi:O-acetylhomoserine/O-acetylserine sulfhydrylase-like pyridoxal-dependent enzyme
MKFGTKAIHAGMESDLTTGAIMTPIYQTSTYVQEDAEDLIQDLSQALQVL